MKEAYNLFVNGIPKAQPRPRMTFSGHVYNPISANDWKNQIKAAFLPFKRPPITAPIRLQVSFFMPRPKRLKGDDPIPHIAKPDTDNLLKAVMDAMTDARVWKDDAQVYAIKSGKWYAEGEPGAWIIVETHP